MIKKDTVGDTNHCDLKLHKMGSLHSPGSTEPHSGAEDRMLLLDKEQATWR